MSTVKAKKNGKRRNRVGKSHKTVPHEQAATPQTQAKLKRGTLQLMIEKNKISSIGAEMQAAEELAKVYEYLTSAVTSASGSMERTSRGVGPEDPHWFVTAYQRRYKLWANTQTAVAMDIVISIVVHRFTASDMDRRYRWRRGTSGKILLWSLRRYALEAGWVAGRQAERWHDTIREGRNALVG